MIPLPFRRLGSTFAGLLACAGAASGCATTASTTSDGLTELAASQSRVAALEAENRAQADEVRRLRAQLALARSEPRREGPPPAREPVPPSRATSESRGGAGRERADTREAEEEVWDEPVATSPIRATPLAARSPADDGEAPRPVLRLAGSPGTLPVAVVNERLPTTSFVPPLVTVTPAADAAAVSNGGSGDRRARDAYRAALAHLTARRFERALESLSRFVEQHPAHPYADDALYWRGTAYYALRQYTAALGDFLRVIAVPSGTKVADALFQIGMCHVRMGDPSRAHAYFRRVQAEYPDTVAARLASREGAT